MSLPELPDKIAGWRALGFWLESIGAPVSGKYGQLCSAARRNALPIRRTGKTAHWTGNDLNVWVRHFCGVDFDLWVQQVERDKRTERGRVLRGAVAMQGDRLHRRSAAWPMFLAILETDGAATVYREPDRARVFQARSKKRVLAWPDDVLKDGMRLLYYRRSRPGEPGDFDGPRPLDRSAYGAFRLYQGTPRWIRVSSAVFGIDGEHPTPLLALGCSPELPELYRLARSMHPGCVWVCWYDALCLDPATLQPAADSC